MDADFSESGSPAGPKDDLRPTGQVRMDMQHRRILQAMGLLVESLGAPFPEESLDIRVRRIRDLAREHFAEEESLMEASGYPYLEAHRADHEVLRDRCEDLIAGYGSTYSASLPALCGTITELFRRHVEMVDSDYAVFLESVAGRQDPAVIPSGD
jgi:hemerythrin